ncbi:WD40 repeat-like protein [Lindgomyces ingoldianus]|uniref:WD40 repeat-like protein n=1 Tax=Lindgomyces ingoldianus TaxID=673940 RepID=A0ACB6QUN5_9PLEO|nr:WD40 repeat-like protein [Lindgomyces ingoldianus]KAF2470610.1 WD40 repeat-like protein [Lindgomyces ingoldianus]
MTGSDHGTRAFSPRPVTPPLSPTKSTSTADWTVPNTPVSPRKTRSSFFFRDIGADPFSPTPPTSPTKLSFTDRCGALYLSRPAIPHLEYESSQSASPSLTDHGLEWFSSLTTRGCSRSARLNNRSAPIRRASTPQLVNVSDSCAVEHTSQVATEKGGDRWSPNRIQTSEDLTQSPHSLSPRGYQADHEAPLPPLHATISGCRFSPTKLSRIPLRNSSSPLRPSQWATRGGLLSAPRRSNRAQDRFIPSRRPPNTARDSFELNKAADRLTPEEKITRGSTTPGADPFSRRLRRSGRLNAELRTLRETHSVITGRANMNRRGANLGLRRSPFSLGVRQVSAGAVWNVGGSSAVSDTVVGVSNGRGGVLGSGTNAPLYTSLFLSRSDPEAELEAYERRLALALDVNQADRVLGHTTPPQSPITPKSNSTGLHGNFANSMTHVWRDNAWMKDGSTLLLDAPQLRDDYYCSLLAYSHTSKCLAVGLGNFVHLWSEQKGVDTPESLNTLSIDAASEVQHVTSLAFSSVQGGQSILAVGRADGRINLWSPFDPEPRFQSKQPKPISCVSFRPTMVRRPSLRDMAIAVPTEELLVGDEAGQVYLYSIEWPNQTDAALFGWNGALTLLARMTMHTQQICGLSWSIDGELFASGGNDNACYLFETKKILQNQVATDSLNTLSVRYDPNSDSIWSAPTNRGPVLSIEPGREKHKWELNAAVKAIAFCPWQRGLVAIGGGSNDRCIHFYHTVSGACLATIDCAAQVTSLIWSTTRREVAATFGFAQPEHPFRVAVFAWPSCEQIVAIPWYDENRALYAISFPGGPNTGRDKGEDGVWWGRTVEEGCIVVAASDSAIRFHEIWTEEKKSVWKGAGILGGSDILENLHGIEKEGYPTIR